MKYKKKCILVFSSIFAVILATFASAFHFNIIANASTDGIAYYGEQLNTETPSALGGSEYTGYSWTDDETDYFGEIGEQVFVVSNGSDYKNLTITVQPRELNPILKYGDSPSTIPIEWAGNPNKHTLSDFTGTTTFNANGGVFESNVMAVADTLPTKVGDVSIMPLYQLYSLCSTDPNNGYNTSTYYVYGICDSTGSTGSTTGSTSNNLYNVGLQWYKQLNKPTTNSQTWTQAGHKVFGGPFYLAYSSSSGYYFGWWYSTGNSYGSYFGNYWSGNVDTSVYVAVVCAVGDIVEPSTTYTETTTIGSAVTLPTEPTRDGYDFDGWWTTADDSGEKVTSIIQGGTPKTYYAHWSVQNTMAVTSSLPTKVDDVSIMTIRQAFTALANSNNSSSNYHYDPSYGYTTSQYYVYGIVGSSGTNSTAANLQAVGLSWYKQHNKPTTASQTFTNNGKTIFGGPLYNVCYGSDSDYYFYWCYSTSSHHSSSYYGYWDHSVASSVCVAVVRVK